MRVQTLAALWMQVNKACTFANVCVAYSAHVGVAAHAILRTRCRCACKCMTRPSNYSSLLWLALSVLCVGVGQLEREQSTLVAAASMNFPSRKE